MRSANNDCCCHIADNAKTVGLDKVQDVQLVEHWCLTCFNLKQVRSARLYEAMKGEIAYF